MRFKTDADDPGAAHAIYSLARLCKTAGKGQDAQPLCALVARLAPSYDEYLKYAVGLGKSQQLIFPLEKRALVRRDIPAIRLTSASSRPGADRRTAKYLADWNKSYELQCALRLAEAGDRSEALKYRTMLADDPNILILSAREADVAGDSARAASDCKAALELCNGRGLRLDDSVVSDCEYLANKFSLTENLLKCMGATDQGYVNRILHNYPQGFIDLVRRYARTANMAGLAQLIRIAQRANESAQQATENCILEELARLANTGASVARISDVYLTAAPILSFAKLSSNHAFPYVSANDLIALTKRALVLYPSNLEIKKTYASLLVSQGERSAANELIDEIVRHGGNFTHKAAEEFAFNRSGAFTESEQLIYDKLVAGSTYASQVQNDSRSVGKGLVRAN
jgi:hypothetical protein